MRKFVREGRKLRERKIGIFGGMDVRMGSMLFSPPFCGRIPLSPLQRQFFFTYCFLLLLAIALFTPMRRGVGREAGKGKRETTNNHI